MLEDRNGGSERGRDENEEKEKVEGKKNGGEEKKKKEEDTVNYFSSDISVVGGSVSSFVQA